MAKVASLKKPISPLGVAHRPQLAQRGRGLCVTKILQGFIERAWIGLRKVHQVEHILEQNCVIHRAALEMPAVGQDLLVKLARAPAMMSISILSPQRPTGAWEVPLGARLVAQSN